MISMSVPLLVRLGGNTVLLAVKTEDGFFGDVIRQIRGECIDEKWNL